MEYFWAVVNAIIILGFYALVVIGIIWLIKLNRRMAKVEALLLELQKNKRCSALEQDNRGKGP
ncbi:MAG: hypothetical protein QHH75_09950 [Bacillota bacterium]|nr:hypothetical protein [Bacillota bacterium]